MSSDSMEKITKKMVLGEVIGKYPETVEVFLKSGMHCISCQMATSETIEQAAGVHGINTEKLIKDLNKAIKKK
jgi:hybrid cluster-associated redox disulfide protein